MSLLKAYHSAKEEFFYFYIYLFFLRKAWALESSKHDKILIQILKAVTFGVVTEGP